MPSSTRERSQNPRNARGAPPAAVAAPGRPVEQSYRVYRALLAACFAASLLISYPTWLSPREYPLVPLIDGLPEPPRLLALGMFAAILGCLAAVAVLSRPRPWLWAALAIGAVWALLDLTRWQPWYAAALLALLCLAQSPAPPRFVPVLAPVQGFTVAMYVWSGAHKLNHHYLTRDFVTTATPVLAWLRVRPGDLSPPLLAGFAVASALLELGCGLLLLTRRRRIGVIGLSFMHLFILAAIGPLGSRWNPVVWPWNVASIAGLWLLFWPEAPFAAFRTMLPGQRTATGGAARRLPAGLRLTWVGVLLVFGLMPALSFADRWMASLSFQLYAGKERIALLYYDPAQRDALPPSARAAERQPGQVNLTAWSLHALGVTPVLEPRTVLSIGRTLARQAPRAKVAVLLASPPALTSSRRTTRYFVFQGAEQEPVDASAEYTVQLHEDPPPR